MILRNVKFCSYINTVMRKWIDWFYKEKENRDLGLTWMSHGNAGGFLENHESYNKKSNWLYGSPDVEQNFQKTIDAGIPKYWRWHNEQIEYDMNSDGFRTRELDKVDWKNSYVILGCSHIHGLGNQYHETIGEFISRKIAAPVINLGVGGISNEVIYNNLLKQLKTYGKAKGYFIMWTYSNRFANVGKYWYARDNSMKPFWAIDRVVPENMSHKNAEVTDQFISQLMYRRNIIWHSTRLLLQDVPLSEILEPHCWAIEDLGDTKIPIKHPAGSGFSSHIPWNKQSDAYKEWYLNKICARDIMKYSHTKGPEGSHWGPAVNSKVAQHLVDGLK